MTEMVIHLYGEAIPAKATVIVLFDTHKQALTEMRRFWDQAYQGVQYKRITYNAMKIVVGDVTFRFLTKRPESVMGRNKDTTILYVNGHHKAWMYQFKTIREYFNG